MSGPRAAIVHLGRRQSMGEERRVRSWQLILAAAGIESVRVRLLADHRGRPSVGQAVEVARGTAVPETLAWSAESVRRALDELCPDVVICVTARAYEPGLSDRDVVTVLDFVDRLGVSYRDRARIVGFGGRRMLFRALGAANAGFERRPVGPGVEAVAAGWADAEALGVPWVPIVIDEGPAIEPSAMQQDILFLGNLAYPPNVAAVERLGRMWPEIVRRRPGTTAMLAGASPTPRVTHLAERWGWQLMADFPDLSAVCSRARLAVVPLDHASGIQCKILEAASKGMPQVVTPAAAAGLDPDFPVTVAADDGSFAAAVVTLLDDPGLAVGAGMRARLHMDTYYRPVSWAGWARNLLLAGGA